ncbi:MAG: JmjC domain-containing protein [Aquabacterium sp.]|uniref:JmjC domain-containing protein n=1 Tax=Aquabacterium sp. TaxID=1872578 RepID=UPI003BDD7E33
MKKARTTDKPSTKVSATETAQAPQVAGPLAIDEATPLLGGISPETFMRKYWQKKPLLIRQAVPGAVPPIDRAKLFALAGEEEVESRLIVRDMPGDAPKARSKATKGAKPSPGWKLAHGPFTRRSLPAMTQSGWTLLVQGLDLHVPAAHDLMQQFRFVPDARLDDLMISYATDGGGVGPHYDSYDVFLLQVHGKRRWRIGRLKDSTLQEDVPLKILTNFEPEHEYVLEPGDMLYLPPKWAHDGIAEGECMTCSIGFRVPEATELAREVLVRWVEEIECDDKVRLYQDPKQPATAHPGRIPDALQKFTAEAIERLLKDPDGLKSALGEILTEPKPRVWFHSGAPLQAGVGVRLDARTRMVYDDDRVFANGESWRAAGKDARHLRQLADKRFLDARTVSQVSDDLRDLLDQWSQDGWLHPLTA